MGASVTGWVEGLLVGSSLGADELVSIDVGKIVGESVSSGKGDEVGEYDGNIVAVGSIDKGDAVGPRFSGTVYEMLPWLCMNCAFRLKIHLNKFEVRWRSVARNLQ